MAAIWRSRSVPDTSRIYTAQGRDPIVLTVTYIAHRRPVERPDARLHLSHCRRRHDRRRRGPGPPRGGPGGLARVAPPRAAPPARPPSALERPLARRARRADPGHDGAGRRPPRAVRP